MAPLLLAVLALPCLAGGGAEARPKIVGGDTALPGQFPHQVSVRRLTWFSWRHHCGGTLLTRDWVLTTASCTRGAWFLMVAAGKVNLKIKEDGEQEAKVSTTVVHPDFRPGMESSWQNDIALLRTSYPFQFTDLVRPARLPLTKYNTSECGRGALLVTGWGVMEPGGWFGWGRRWADKLQVTVVQTSPCLSSTGSTGPGLCVADGSTATPCEGDEGAAMVQMLGDSTFTVVGMVTRTPTNCKSPREPSAAVSVFEQSKFIQDTLIIQ